MYYLVAHNNVCRKLLTVGFSFVGQGNSCQFVYYEWNSEKMWQLKKIKGNDYSSEKLVSKLDSLQSDGRNFLFQWDFALGANEIKICKGQMYLFLDVKFA